MLNSDERDFSNKQKLLEFLLTFISENKKNKFNTIIPNRTRYITIILEDIYQPHNASAVLRSCDCLLYTSDAADE